LSNDSELNERNNSDLEVKKQLISDVRLRLKKRLKIIETKIYLFDKKNDDNSQPL
jgi:hypothetical protein